MTDSIDITIEEAEEGDWKYTTRNHCDRSVNYEIETRGSGSGMIAGRVFDAYTGEGLMNAEVVFDAGGSARTFYQGYYTGVAAAGVGAVRVTRQGYQVHIKTNEVVVAGQTTTSNFGLKPENAAALPAPEGRNTFEIISPSEEPNPGAQPVAARVSDGKLELNALFPPRSRPVDLYVGLAIDYPGLTGQLLFFNENDIPVLFTGALPPWRRAVTEEQFAQLLPPIPLEALPPADYTLYILITPDSSTLADYDLIYFTFTLGQAPPSGQSNITIVAPDDTPNPMIQPMAAKETDGALEISVYFPPQQEPVSIYLTRQGPGPSGARHILNAEGQWVESADALLPWREAVVKKQQAVVFSGPLADMAPGEYTFSSMVAAASDPSSNFNRVIFTKTIGD